MLGITAQRRPLPPLRTIVKCQPLPTDGLHRVVSDDVMRQLCPGGLSLLANVNAAVGTAPAPVAFGKEIYISTVTATNKSVYNGFIPTVCGLQACKRKIMPGDFVSFACVAFPESHIYSAFPFLPISDFPSRNGLRTCLFHGLISLMPDKAAFLEPNESCQVFGLARLIVCN